MKPMTLLVAIVIVAVVPYHVTPMLVAGVQAIVHNLSAVIAVQQSGNDAVVFEVVK